MKKTRQLLFIFITFIAAWVLMILPIPSNWQWITPEWPTLVLIYWIFVQPELIGIATAWCVGLVMDSLYGGILGQYALSLTVVAFFARFLRYRIWLIPPWQRGLMIFGLLGVGSVLLFLVHRMIGYPTKSAYYWVPLLSGMLIWPGIKRLMDLYERKLLV